MTVIHNCYKFKLTNRKKCFHTLEFYQGFLLQKIRLSFANYVSHC